MESLLLGEISFLITLGLSIFLTGFWIKAARSAKLVGKDLNKYDKPAVPEGGGVAAVLAIVFAISLYIFIKTYLLHTETHLLEAFAILATLLLACFVGFMDDILGWLKGLKSWHKVLLTLPIALPMVIVNVHHSTMNFPFLGPVNFGLLYPLAIVPIAVIGSSNGVNLLAGYNGLEAGLGSIILGTLGFVAWWQGDAWLALIAFCAVAALIGFLAFNWFPAKIFPGDSLTYSIGALIAVIAILGNMEKLALFLFIPFFLDAILLVRARNIKVKAFSKVNPDDSLEAPYSKSYDTTHIALRALKWLRGKVYEKDVVKLLLVAEFIICIIGLKFIWLGGLG